MPGREPKKKKGRDDTTRASASSPPPPQRQSGRQGLSTSVDKDSENQDMRGPKIKSTLLRDSLLSLLFFGVSFGCGYWARGTIQPARGDLPLQAASILHPPQGPYTSSAKMLHQALSRRFGSLTLVSLVTRVRLAQLPAASS